MAFRPSFWGMRPFGGDFLSERTCQCAYRIIKRGEILCE